MEEYLQAFLTSKIETFSQFRAPVPWFSSQVKRVQFIQWKSTTELDMVIPQQVEVDQGVPGRLRPRIFVTFGTTRVVGRQLYAPTAFTLGEIPGTHFQGIWFRRGNHGKNPQWHHRELIPGPSD